MGRFTRWGYHTMGILTRWGITPLEDGLARGIITRRILNQNRKDLNPLVSGPKQFVLTLLKPATGLNVFLIFLTAKSEEIQKKIVTFV